MKHDYFSVLSAMKKNKEELLGSLAVKILCFPLQGTQA